MEKEIIYNDNRDLNLPPKDLSKKTKRIRGVIKLFEKWFPPPLTILDVGTRDGYAVDVFNQKGYKAEGIELIDNYIKDAQSKDRPVVFGDMMDVSTLPTKKYDVVYSRHTIEHCRDGLKFMYSCSYLLKSDGKLFLIFPLEKDKKLVRDTQRYHMINYPTIAAFKKMAKKTPFKTIKIGMVQDFGLPKRKKKELLFVGEKL